LNRWRYLGYYFDANLSFEYHVNFYFRKAFSTIRALIMFGKAEEDGNMTCSPGALTSNQKPPSTHGMVKIALEKGSETSVTSPS
jgi:hypothetical protein